MQWARYFFKFWLLISDSVPTIGLQPEYTAQKIRVPTPGIYASTLLDRCIINRHLSMVLFQSIYIDDCCFYSVNILCDALRPYLDLTHKPLQAAYIWLQAWNVAVGRCALEWGLWLCFTLEWFLCDVIELFQVSFSSFYCWFLVMLSFKRFYLGRLDPYCADCYKDY